VNLDDVRVALTVLSFLVFVGIAVWAYSRHRQRDFDEAANLPFSGHDFDAKGDQTASKEHNR
jgi:cytochrome c oxidase cbb3-type subunit IV